MTSALSKDYGIGTYGAPIEDLVPQRFLSRHLPGQRPGRDFRDDHDRTRFEERLRGALEIFSVRVHAYVLMSNHFHLIVETPKANLSEFMRQFNISYTGYYNRRHRRLGHLYQGRFKAIVVDSGHAEGIVPQIRSTSWLMTSVGTHTILIPFSLTR